MRGMGWGLKREKYCRDNREREGNKEIRQTSGGEGSWRDQTRIMGWLLATRLDSDTSQHVRKQPFRFDIFQTVGDRKHGLNWLLLPDTEEALNYTLVCWNLKSFFFFLFFLFLGGLLPFLVVSEMIAQTGFPLARNERHSMIAVRIWQYIKKKEKKK